MYPYNIIIADLSYPLIISLLGGEFAAIYNLQNLTEEDFIILANWLEP
jgi:hypothetical protein